MNWTHLEQIRSAEAELALVELQRRKPPRANLIEIGGGSGWQAQKFAQAGYDVASFDLRNNEYAGRRAYPVQDYDGHHLPAESACADIVFSSNVLEHIAHVRAFQVELLRVLKLDGIALHILPTPSWRLWTSVTHYPWVTKKLAARLTGGTIAQPPYGEGARAESQVQNTSLGRIFKNALYPARHGEIGNSITELYYFSRHRWARLFEATGWRIDHYATNGLAYTGHSLVGGALGLSTRRRMSRFLGSSCHVFVLRKV
jgi:ubiquinone/menaquinone biosynthesis C-methylase UbiE